MKWLSIILIIQVFYTGAVVAQGLPESKVWSLQDCLDYALENNITIQGKKLDLQSAEINYQQTKYNKLPSVSGSASGNLSNGYSIDPITSDFVNKTITSNSYGINGQLVLYQGNRLNLEIEKNSFLTEQAKLYQQQAENNITLSVLEQYLQALYYFEGIQIAENNLASSKANLDLTTIKFENGAIAKLDLADIETQHAQNQYNLANSQSLYAQQVLRLKQLLELPPEYEFEIEKISLPELTSALPDKMQAFNDALNILPDVKLYNIQKSVLEKEYSISKAAAKPTLSLGAGVNSGFTNTMDYNYFTQLHRNFSQQISLSLNIPIFSKFQNRTNTQLAKNNLQQNELNKIAASKTLYSDIETAWLNATTNGAQLLSAKTAKNNAALAYELATKKYEFGGLTPTELNVSRNTYLSNEQTYLQTKYMAVLYRQLLNYYQGKNFDITHD